MSVQLERPATPDQIELWERKRDELRDSGVQYCVSSFVDMNGIPKGKAVPIDLFVPMMKGSELYTGFAVEGVGQEAHEDELSVWPDLDSITQMPWEPTMAWAPGHLHLYQEPWPMCSRNVLERQLERARSHNLMMNLGIESEFFLVKREEGRVRFANPRDVLDKAAYDVDGLLDAYGFLRKAVEYAAGLGVNMQSFDHEDANSQFEFDFLYSDAKTMADRFVMLRMMLKRLALQHGWEATFMPKPFAHTTGNAGHFNMSLADVETGENRFSDPNDPRGNGLSEIGYQFIAGILRHTPAIVAVAAPIVNSYKRLIKTGSRTGATWAPVYISYGPNNRTHVLRISSTTARVSTRVECRASDGACNPYLTAAMLLSAGLEGIENDYDPGDPITDNMYGKSDEELREMGVATLPRTLLEAVEAFAEDDLAESTFGKELKQTFIELKRQEWWDFHNRISEWEIDRYVQMY